jgi:hypothetical protein
MVHIYNDGNSFGFSDAIVPGETIVLKFGNNESIVKFFKGQGCMGIMDNILKGPCNTSKL